MTDGAYSMKLLAPLPDPQVLLQSLTASLGHVVNRVDPRLPPLGARGRFYASYWGYLGRAAIYGYRATDNRRFVDMAISVLEHLLSDRSEVKRAAGRHA